MIEDLDGNGLSIMGAELMTLNLFPSCLGLGGRFGLPPALLSLTDLGVFSAVKYAC